MTEKKTCTQCKKRVGLIGLTCRCQKLFCAAHLPAEEHACTFDYKSHGTSYLSTMMVPVRSEHGLEKI